LRIDASGNVGIGTSPGYKCHIKCTYDNVATGLHLDAGDNGVANLYTLTIWPFVLGGGQVGWKFRTLSSNGGDTTPLAFTNDGSCRFQVDRWHQDSNGVARIYFGNGHKMYLNSNGNSDILELRQNGGTLRALINSNGQIAAHFQTISPTNTDYVGVSGNTASGGFGYYYMHVLFNTFTGFHRCFYEDDEIFNNNMNDEEIDILKIIIKAELLYQLEK